MRVCGMETQIIKCVGCGGYLNSWDQGSQSTLDLIG